LIRNEPDIFSMFPVGITDTILHTSLSENDVIYDLSEDCPR
jgi:hypothetical protein